MALLPDARLDGERPHGVEQRPARALVDLDPCLCGPEFDVAPTVHRSVRGRGATQALTEGRAGEPPLLDARGWRGRRDRRHAREQIFALDLERHATRGPRCTVASQFVDGAVECLVYDVEPLAPVPGERLVMPQRHGTEGAVQRRQGALLRMLAEQIGVANGAEQILTTCGQLVPRTERGAGLRERGQHRTLSLEADPHAMHRVARRDAGDALEVAPETERRPLEARREVPGERCRGGREPHPVEQTVGGQPYAQPFGDRIVVALEGARDTRGRPLPMPLQARAQHARFLPCIVRQLLPFGVQPRALDIGIADGVGGLSQRPQRLPCPAVDGAVERALMLTQDGAQPAEGHAGLVQRLGGVHRGRAERVGRHPLLPGGNGVPARACLPELLEPMQRDQTGTLLRGTVQRLGHQPPQVGRRQRLTLSGHRGHDRRWRRRARARCRHRRSSRTPAKDDSRHGSLRCTAGACQSRGRG